MARLEFSRKTRRAIFERAQGKCEACRAILKVGEGEVDHILPAILGGTAEQANGWLLCRVCHGNKTREDIRRTRKADRMRDKNNGVMPKSQRGFRKPAGAKYDWKRGRYTVWTYPPAHEEQGD